MLHRADDMLSEPPLKRQRDEELPCGPKTAEESFGWAESSFNKLQQRGKELVGEDCAALVKSALRSGLCWRTDYSGLGSPEEALHDIFNAFSADATRLYCQRAGDMAPHCRHVLCNRSGPSKPECVHMNITDRFAKQLTEALESTRRAYVETFEKRVEAAKNQTQQQKKALADALGYEFVKKAKNTVLRNMSQEAVAQHAAKCAVHGGACPVFPSPPEAFQGYVCSAAGVNCYDFSTMGAGKRYLGESVVPFILWLCERLWSDEDFFVVECVEGFNDALLQCLLGDAFQVTCLRVCPSLFGLPITRRRKYMLCFLAWPQWAIRRPLKRCSNVRLSSVLTNSCVRQPVRLKLMLRALLSSVGCQRRAAAIVGGAATLQ